MTSHIKTILHITIEHSTWAQHNMYSLQQLYGLPPNYSTYWDNLLHYTQPRWIKYINQEQKKKLRDKKFMEGTKPNKTRQSPSYLVWIRQPNRRKGVPITGKKETETCLFQLLGIQQGNSHNIYTKDLRRGRFLSKH